MKRVSKSSDIVKSTLAFDEFNHLSETVRRIARNFLKVPNNQEAKKLRNEFRFYRGQSSSMKKTIYEHVDGL